MMLQIFYDMLLVLQMAYTGGAATIAECSNHLGIVHSDHLLVLTTAKGPWFDEIATVAFDLGGFPWVLRFPPSLTTGWSR